MIEYLYLSFGNEYIKIEHNILEISLYGKFDIKDNIGNFKITDCNIIPNVQIKLTLQHVPTNKIYHLHTPASQDVMQKYLIFVNAMKGQNVSTDFQSEGSNQFFNNPYVLQEGQNTNFESEYQLINCPACGQRVSVQAMSCPNCGFPIKEHVSKQNGEFHGVYKNVWGRNERVYCPC